MGPVSVLAGHGADQVRHDQFNLKPVSAPTIPPSRRRAITWRSSITYHIQGRLPEAENEHRLALAAKTKRLGHDHPDLVGSEVNLAGTLLAQDKHREALEMAQRAWDHCRAQKNRPRPSGDP